MDFNIVIPMAGAGTRFADAGYEKPKPFIEIDGKPMIQHVVENLNLNGQHIFIGQLDHWLNHNLEFVLKSIKPDCKFNTVGGLTDGAAITVTSVKSMINNDTPLIIANSDQLISWDSSEFLNLLEQTENDGVIAIFESDDPKWSYAEIVDGKVVRVAEKEVISNNATVGIYGWKRGSDFIKYTQQMINKDIRTNGEFYIAPVYNQAIEDGKNIVTYTVSEMHGIGTPEDLDAYLENRNV